MRFSIIMPVYNAGRYLPAAIDSILNQSYGDFELIIIDDGSTDGSVNLIQNYAKKDTRIVPVTKKNGGICNSRNVGMGMARGDYIGFCDHDDEYLPGYLSAVYAAIEKLRPENADIVKVCHEMYLRTADGSSKYAGGGFACTEGKLDLNNYADSHFRNIVNTCWDSFYRHEFLARNNFKFDESIKKGGEDLYFNLQVLHAAKLVWHCGMHHYYRHYNNIGMSVSSVSHPELIEAYFKSINYEISHFPILDQNIEKRFWYWVYCFSDFVFFATGNRISFFRSALVYGKVARLLLPRRLILKTRMNPAYKILSLLGLYAMFGMVLRTKLWQVRLKK